MIFSTSFVAATKEYSTFEKPIPAPCFRREFELGKIDSAEVTICGLGIYELYINGQRITRGLLSSYLYNPDDILYYDNYDLAPYLTEGKNVIGVILGNGMLNSYGGQIWAFEKARYRSAPKLALTFEAKLADGSSLSFDATDGFVCTESPIYVDDIRIGEFYDARRELDGWDKPGYDAGSWREPIAAETPRGECRLCNVDPILPSYELTPVEIHPGKISLTFHSVQRLLATAGEEMLYTYPEGEGNVDGFIYDFGVNAAGLCRLHIKNARPGQKIIMQFGEQLAEDGGLDLRGMDFLPYRYDHRDIYICKGGDETYIPRFTYHGFRYCLVTGIDADQATNDLLTYVVMNTSFDTRSTFSCSDEITNKLWNAAIVSDCANFYHFPTDCPHREKNGWTGDAAISAEQMVMALSPERNWREWLNNIRKAMKEDGSIPGIVPTAGWGYEWGNGAPWDAIIAYLPYFAWLYRGDTEILKENADAILRHVNYIAVRRNELGLINYGLDDWCTAGRTNDNRKATTEFTNTVISMDICRKAAKIFEVLGRKPQMIFAQTIADELRDALRANLIDLNNMVTVQRCQTHQAIAIFYDVFTNTEKPLAFQRLVEIINANDDHIDCGIVGMRVIFHVLSEYGRTDLAYKMITRTDYPSYGYWIANGATSLWEDFYPMSFKPNSRNHHFFGDIISWFMKNLVGINVNPNKCDPNEIRFAPKFIDALDNAEGSYKAPAGEVKASWKRTDEGIVYSVSVPAGVKASIALECGWHFNDGFTFKRISGNCEFTIIPENVPDKNAIRI